jgi:beta-mannosidase
LRAVANYHPAAISFTKENAIDSPLRKCIPMTWTVGHSTSPDISPEQRVPATVPGAVQLDWAKSQGWEEHVYGDNWKQYLRMEDAYWHYSAKIEADDIGGGQLWFVSKGIDYRFIVRLSGKTLHEQEGMFRPVEINLSAAGVKRGDVLEVIIWPAPKSLPDSQGRTRNQANQSCKPAVSYGWDFHPRLIPLGIWDETYLESRPSCHIRQGETRYELSPDLKTAHVSIHISLSAADAAGMVHWNITAPDGTPVIEQSAKADRAEIVLEASIQNPALWWPNGQGEAALYRSVLELDSPAEGAGGVDRVESRVGFRRVRLIMAPDQWAWPKYMPKTRSNPPITLEINGRAIFAKGSNWVPPDIFFGRLDESVYREQLNFVRDANMNLLRVWGGGIVNRTAFFDLCDEMGIMVWQEFPLACNRYEGTPHYLSVLDSESRAIIKKIRRHPSLVLWCGGNELFNAWSGMTDQDLPLRLLNKNTYELDPSRPFLPTSPVMGMGHGNYVFRSVEGDEVFTIFADSDNTAYTEFGCPGPASVEILKKIIPESELFPPRNGGAWITRHAFEAWSTESWLFLSVIEDYFGPSPDLQTLVDRGQLLQAEGYKCLFEEARRHKPRASMALNWCLNEPWPTAANNSLISWPNKPKPALKAVAAACRPILASAKIGKFRWYAGETFEAELWLLNDSPNDVPATEIEATLHLPDHAPIPLVTWQCPALKPNENWQGPSVRLKLPKLPDGPMLLSLRGPKDARIDSDYTLVYRTERPPEGGWKPGAMNV